MLSRKRFLIYGLGSLPLLAAGAVGFTKIYKRNHHVTDIVEYPDHILREQSEPVSRITEPIIALSKGMISTLRYYMLIEIKDLCIPLGLSAPQVGVLKRVIVCGIHGEIYTLVNPEIVEKSGSYISSEVCLSLPQFDEREVKRPYHIKVKYRALDNKERTLVLSGRYAALLEHEIDHLKGRLYIDYPEVLHA